MGESGKRAARMISICLPMPTRLISLVSGDCRHRPRHVGSRRHDRAHRPVHHGVRSGGGGSRSIPRSCRHRGSAKCAGEDCHERDAHLHGCKKAARILRERQCGVPSGAAAAASRSSRPRREETTAGSDMTKKKSADDDLENTHLFPLEARGSRCIALSSAGSAN